MASKERLIEELAKLRQGNISAKKITTTVGEDISNLGHNIWEGVKNLPRATGQTVEAIGQNPGQFAAGLIPGAASFADIPALIGNAALWVPQYVTQKIMGDEEYRTPDIPYYGHQFGTNIANSLAGIPQSEEQQRARFGGELAGSFINPGVLANKTAEGVAKKATQVSPEKVNIFKEAGLTPTLGEVTNSNPVMRAQELIRRSPAGESPFQEASKLREEQLEQVFNEHAKLKKALSPLEAGEVHQEGAKAYNDKAKSIAGKLYDKAWSHIEPKTKVPLQGTLDKINELLSAETIEARTILQDSPAGRKLIELENAIKNNGGSLPLTDLRNVYRKSLDDMIDSWGQIGNSEQGILKTIRKTIDDGIKDFVVQQKPVAAKDFARADKFWSAFSERNRGIANKTIKADNPVQVFSKTFGAIKRGDLKPNEVLMKRLPQREKEALSATYMNELGRGTAGEFDPYKWEREYTKLRPESRKAVASGFASGTDKKLDSIADAIKLSKTTRGQANHSGTTYTAALIGLPPALWIAPGTTTATIAATYGLGRLFTNLKVIDNLAKVTKLKTPEQLNKFLSKQSVLPRMEEIRQLQQEQEEKPSRDSLIEELTKLRQSNKRTIPRIDVKPSREREPEQILNNAP